MRRFLQNGLINNITITMLKLSKLAKLNVLDYVHTHIKTKEELFDANFFSRR